MCWPRPASPVFTPSIPSSAKSQGDEPDEIRVDPETGVCSVHADSPGAARRSPDSAASPGTSALSPLYPATPVSYTHLRAHETDSYLVCRLLLEKKKTVN